MDLKKVVQDHYKNYANAPGSEYIVSEFGLYNILKLIKKYRVKNILEIGVGIGTISGGILKYAEKNEIELNCTGTENNKYCLDQIQKNLGSIQSKLKIYSFLDKIPSSVKYDLIIIDGLDPSLEILSKFLNPGALIVIEGDRADQTKLIRRLFPRSLFSPRVSTQKNPPYTFRDINKFQTGIKVIYANPNLQQKFDWGIMKILMKFRYFKRNNLS